MRSLSNLLVIAALAGAVCGGLAATLVTVLRRPVEIAAPQAAAPTQSRDDAHQAIAALEARIDALESERAPAGPVGRAETDVAEGLDRMEDFERRLSALEARLSADVRTGAAPDAVPGDPAGLLAAIGELERTGVVDDELRGRRIALRRLFLERYPNSPQAAAQLEELVGDYLESDPPQALGALGDFGGSVDMPPWRIDGLAAGAHAHNRQFDQARALQQRILSLAQTPEDIRAQTKFEYAYTFVEEGRHAEARAQFELIVATLGREPVAPALRNVVAGARSQLEALAKLENL